MTRGRRGKEQDSEPGKVPLTGLDTVKRKMPLRRLGIFPFHSAILFRSSSTSGVNPDTVRRIVLPQLSPSFEGGILSQWNVQAGSEVDDYDSVFCVKTTTLTEPQSRGEDPTIEVIVEVMDSGFVGKHRVSVEEAVQPGDLLAFLVENESDIEIVDKHPEEFACCEKFRYQAYLNR